jgi:hypothetical protein
MKIGETKVLMTLEVLLERKEGEIKEKMTIYLVDTPARRRFESRGTHVLIQGVSV